MNATDINLQRQRSPTAGQRPANDSKDLARAGDLTTIRRNLPTFRSSLATCLAGALFCVLALLSPGCRRQHPLAPYVAYVLNQQSATLAAVNLADFRVTASLPVAARPERVLARPHARELYVVSATGRISIVGYPDVRLLSTLEVGASAQDLQFASDGKKAFVLNPAAHELLFLDCSPPGAPSAETALPRVSSRLHLAGTLRGLALSPDGNILVAASTHPNQVALVSVKNRRVLATTAVGEDPGPLAILPDDSKVFVADSGEKKVSIVSLPSGKLFGNVETGARLNSLLLKPDGGEIFALGTDSSTMVIFDTFHDNVERTFPFGSNPVAGVFRRDMSLLYIANSGDGSVQAMDVQNREVAATTHVGVSPVALALTPDERLLVVADRGASSLAILQADPASLANDRSALLTTIQVGASPIDVVIPNNINR